MALNLLWLLPVAATFVLWGLWGFLPKFALNKGLEPMDIMLHEVVGAIVIGVALLCFMGFKVKLHPTGSLFALAAGMVNYLGILCYLYALRVGSVSLTATLTALYPLCAIALAYFLLGEAVTVKQLAGIGFAMISVVLLAG